MKTVNIQSLILNRKSEIVNPWPRPQSARLPRRRSHPGQDQVFAWAGQGGLKSQAGFTLVEMLVVIAIIVMVSAVTIPAITPFLKGQRLNKGARIVQAQALAARVMAINSREKRRLVFDSTYSKLSIIDEDSTVVGKAEFLPDTIEFDTSTWRPVGTSTVTVLFDPNGSADTQGTLDTDTVIIKDKQDNTKNLQIISYTGQIKSD